MQAEPAWGIILAVGIILRPFMRILLHSALHPQMRMAR